MVFDPLVLEVPVILPWASRNVVLPVLGYVAVPVILPWASRNVVLVPDVLVVVVDLPFSSLRLAFLSARTTQDQRRRERETGGPEAAS